MPIGLPITSSPKHSLLVGIVPFPRMSIHPCPGFEGLGLELWLNVIRRRLLIFILLVLAVLAFVTRVSWLSAVGNVLVVHDQLAPSDVIVVLAGNSPYRA